MTKYCLIFDTNVLFRSYDRYGDFTCFSFSETLNYVIDEIEKRDIYEWVSIMIPKIVWQEARQQNIAAYNDRIEKIKHPFNNYTMPFHRLQEEMRNYEDFLDSNIRKYKRSLRNRLTTIKELAFPTSSCYKDLVKRAYEKRPPFEGKDKKSDKGFKDALLWESILQFKRKKPQTNIILYTNDTMFNDTLKEEYKREFNNEEILFVKDSTEELLKDKLSKIALEKDSTFPVPVDDDISRLKTYLYSDKFYVDLREFEKQIIGDNEFLHMMSINILALDPIEEPSIINDLEYEYTAFMKCKITIMVNNKETFETEKYLSIVVESVDNQVFNVSDVEIVNNDIANPDVENGDLIND